MEEHNARPCIALDLVVHVYTHVYFSSFEAAAVGSVNISTPQSKVQWLTQGSRGPCSVWSGYMLCSVVCPQSQAGSVCQNKHFFWIHTMHCPAHTLSLYGAAV